MVITAQVCQKNYKKKVRKYFKSLKNFVLKQ